MKLRLDNCVMKLCIETGLTIHYTSTLGEMFNGNYSAQTALLTLAQSC